MKRLLGTALVLSLGFVAFESFSSAPIALASGPSSSELGEGGKVTGDISSDVGEEDRIGVDLVAGCDLSLKFIPKFKSSFTFVDPGGTVIPLTASKSGKTIVKALPIEVSGRYEFRIGATDGTQGVYKLTAVPVWSSKLTFDGSDGDVLDMILPAGSRMKGVVKAQKSPGFVPSIEEFTAPGGGELVGAVAGKKGKVSLPWTDVTDYGTYSMSIGATSGSGAFRAVLKRKVPKLSATKLDVRNGINSVSFADDGVAQVFKSRCASCHNHNHAWAGTYAGAKARALDSLGRMKSGNMPKGSGMPASEIALIESWIKTGRNR